MVKAPSTSDMPRLWAAHCMNGEPFQRDALLMAMASRLPKPLSTRCGQVDNGLLLRSAAHLLDVSLDQLRQRHQAVAAAARLADAVLEPDGFEDYERQVRAFTARLLAGASGVTATA